MCGRLGLCDLGVVVCNMQVRAPLFFGLTPHPRRAQTEGYDVALKVIDKESIDFNQAHIEREVRVLFPGRVDLGALGGGGSQRNTCWWDCYEEARPVRAVLAT